MRGPYDSTIKPLAECICKIKKEKGEVRLNSNQLQEECPISYCTSRRYVDSSVAEAYQRELNLTLKETCPNTQIKRVCDRYAVEVDDPVEDEKIPLFGSSFHAAKEFLKRRHEKRRERRKRRRERFPLIHNFLH